MKGAIGVNKSHESDTSALKVGDSKPATVQDTQQHFTKDERIERSGGDSQSEIQRNNEQEM